MTRSSTFKPKEKRSRKGSLNTVRTVHQEEGHEQRQQIDDTSDEDKEIRQWEEATQECLMTITKVQAWTQPFDSQIKGKDQLRKKLQSWYDELNERLLRVRCLRDSMNQDEGIITEPFMTLIGAAVNETESMRRYVGEMNQLYDSLSKKAVSVPLENDNSSNKAQIDEMDHSSDEQSQQILLSPTFTITDTLPPDKGKQCYSSKVLRDRFITNAVSHGISIYALLAAPTPSIPADVLYRGQGFLIARDPDSTYHPVPQGVDDSRLLICI